MRKAVIGGVIAVIIIGVFGFIWSSVGASGPPLPLQTLTDVPLVGGTGRLDYESLDDARDRLYVAHLGANSVIVFDTAKNRVVTGISGTPSVRGVLAVPELNRVYAAAQGTQEVVVIDATTNAVLTRIKAGDVDGLAYDPRTRRLFVSDEGGATEAVIDTTKNRLIGRVALGGEAGNTQYDDFTHRMLVAVQTRNELVEIEPRTLAITHRFPLPGCMHGHGVAVDARHRFAYIACQVNSAIVRLNLDTGNVDAHSSVGIGADVLAIDFGADRLYIASESGIVTVFDIANRGFKKIGQAFYAQGAHVVAVQARSHHTFFPLANMDGRPTMRIALPTFPEKAAVRVSSPRVLFICQYGTAKSAIAREVFRQRAAARGIPIIAFSRAITPEEHVSPVLRARLLANGIDSTRDPVRTLAADDLKSADVVVIFNPLPQAMPVTRVLDWSALPSMNDAYPRASADLARRVDALLDRIEANEHRSTHQL